MAAELRIVFIGSGAVNFGGAEGPWDHSRRLEQLGGIKVVAIADPDLPKAQEVLKRKQGGPHGDLYSDCQLYADYKDALAATKPDIAFIGTASEMWYSCAMFQHTHTHTHNLVPTYMQTFTYNYFKIYRV